MQQFNYMLKPTTQLLKSICLIAFIGFNFLIAKAQDVQRIEVNGRIIVD